MKLVIGIIICSLFVAQSVVTSLAQTKPQPGKAPEANEAKAAAADPTVDQILDKYVQALGGRQAIEKITSRMAKGTFEVTTMGIKGEVEIYSKAPNKILTIQNISGIGEVRDGYDGRVAWSQNPMLGLREKSGAELASTERSADIHAALKTKQRYSKLELKGKEKVGARETYLILATPVQGSPVKMYFDLQTGLLARTDIEFEGPQGQIHIETTLEDYREVDGMKIPFTTRQESSVASAVIKLTEVKHNVALDDAKFNKPSSQ
jgi:hypothetical protein